MAEQQMQPGAEIAAPRGATSLWMQAIRPFSFTASMVPVLLGAALAMHAPVSSMWSLLPLIIICSLLLHAGTNLASDYYDYKKGVDKADTYGSSRVLVEHIMQPKQLLIGALFCFALCFVLGLVFVYLRGMTILYIGLIGIAGGYFYTGGGPLAYKYIALGDVFVFLLMGPLMVVGSFFVLTGGYDQNILLFSLPIGCLVTAILVANNIRDINDDTAAGVKTISSIVGVGAAKLEYYLLLIVAYLCVIAFVLMKIASPWVLIVLLSLPPALKNLRSIATSDPLANPKGIMMIDVQTAQHHFLFGMLLTIGVVLSALF